MRKRIFSFLLSIIIIFIWLFGRLFSIATEPISVNSANYKRTKVISTVRGTVYDRNLLPLTNGTTKEIMAILPSEDTLRSFKASDDEGVLKHLSEGYLVIKEKEGSQPIYPSDNIKIFKTYERYNSSHLLHILGYTDAEGNGVCGIEKYYNDHLNDMGGKLSLKYTSDAEGRILPAEGIEIANESYYDGSGIVLTIDSAIQKICEDAMVKGNIDKGAVVVLNCKTAEILAAVSFPVYERDKIDEYISRNDSPFINRALTPYPVGSVFKVVTSASALENGITLPHLTCNGSITKSGNTFLCSDTDGHGYIDFNTALADSCNPYFIELGTLVGAENLLETADKTGFGKSIEIADGYFSDKGSLPSLGALNSSAAVGNFAFGQGNLTATPLQIANLFCTVANDGIMRSPQLIYGLLKEGNSFSYEGIKEGERVLKEETCRIIKEALANTVKDGTGKLAFSSLYDCCSKTATAQSGQYDENGNEILYCWFCGFFPIEEPEYVICVMKENGVSGGTDCAPVFKEIAEGIIAIN